MGKVNVIIVDATGNKEQKVGLPDDIKTGIIMVKLVEKIKLPSAINSSIKSLAGSFWKCRLWPKQACGMGM